MTRRSPAAQAPQDTDPKIVPEPEPASSAEEAQHREDESEIGGRRASSDTSADPDSSG